MLSIISTLHCLVMPGVNWYVHATCTVLHTANLFVLRIAVVIVKSQWFMSEHCIGNDAWRQLICKWHMLALLVFLLSELLCVLWNYNSLYNHTEFLVMPGINWYAWHMYCTPHCKCFCPGTSAMCCVCICSDADATLNCFSVRNVNNLYQHITSIDMCKDILIIGLTDRKILGKNQTWAIKCLFWALG